MHFVFAHTNDAEIQQLKQEYYFLREHVFSDMYGKGYYPATADEFDKRDDTCFCFAVEGGKVIAGLRFIFHQPDTDTRLHFESPEKALEIQNLLPHINTSELCYAELGGVVADPDPKYKELHLGTAIQKFAFEQAKAGKIKSDVIVARVTPKNVTVMLRASEQAKLAGMVREDAYVTIQDVPRVIMMFSTNPDFPFLSNEMTQKGIGTPPDEFMVKARAHRNVTPEPQEQRT